MKKLKNLLFTIIMFIVLIIVSCNKATISDVVSSSGNTDIINTEQYQISSDSAEIINNSENSAYDSIVIVKDKGRSDTIKTITEEQCKTMLSLPIAEINVKGEIFVFLIDAQSPISFIDEQTVQNKKLVVIEEITDATGDTAISKTIDKIAYILKDKFHVKPTIENTKLSVKFHTGKDIDGVIGYDLLHKDNESLLLNEKKQYDNVNKQINSLTAFNLN